MVRTNGNPQRVDELGTNKGDSGPPVKSDRECEGPECNLQVEAWNRLDASIERGFEVSKHDPRIGVGNIGGTPWVTDPPRGIGSADG